MSRERLSAQVSSWHPSTNEVTETTLKSIAAPYGLKLQQKVGQAIITNVSASGGTVTYTADNNYSAGNTVSIYNVNPVAYNLQNVTIASATSTQFTVTNAATGTFVSGGIAQRTGEMSVTIPAGIDWVYVIAVGGGGGSYFGYGSNGGQVAWGWTLAQSTCIVGAGGANGAPGAGGGYTRYGHIIALGGSGATNSPGANYWGIPGGTGFGDGVSTSGFPGSNGGKGGGNGGAQGANGGDGISGGGGGQGTPSTGTGNCTGGNGGSGLVGGGGGGVSGTTTGTRTGGNGGNGLGIDGTVYTGGAGTAGASPSGGGGAGIAGNASGGNGGLGGGGGGGSQGGAGGAGILYIYY